MAKLPYSQDQRSCSPNT